MNPFRYAWFPYVFALGFPITVYSHNQSAFANIEILRPALIFLALAAITVFTLRQLIANRPLANALATLPFIAFWLFGFSTVFQLLMLAFVIACVKLRTHELPANIVPILNAMSIGVLLLPILAILQVQHVTRASAVQNVAYSPFSTAAPVSMGDNKPDIYHIVLDAYAGEDALTQVLEYDNTQFFEGLRRLGFAVNESVHVPYNETVHTMSSIFLGQYLKHGEFPIDSSTPSQLRSTLGALIANAPVHQILRGNGYKILHTETGHDFLRYPDDAVVLQAPNKTKLSRFELHLGMLSGLNNVVPSLYAVTDDNPLIRAVKNAFDNDFSEFSSPKFVYEHVLAPHTPFIVDRTGAKTTAFPGFSTTGEGDRVVHNDPERRRLYIDGYLEKLRYVNDRVLDQMERIMASPGDKVIVLHGDHGSGAHYFMDDPERTCMKERFTSFIAVYSNNQAIQAQFDWLQDDNATPVNIYRSLFNAAAEFDLKMLPSQSAFVRFSEPHQLLPIEQERIQATCN